MDNKEKALLCHKEWNGKLETVAKSKVKTREDLAIAYTPGVAEPCKVIAEDKTAAYTYTWKANTVAVVSDGSAVLGLGNIGPYAAMPVMEGKCVLFKEFGNVNAVPICLDTQDTEEIIQAVKNIAPGFGGINLEDISAPRCFEIEERLKEMLDIPVFHDDQHGTAIVVLAGIINGLRVTGKKKEDCRVVVNGAGSAGVAITKLLLTYGFKHVTMCDREGIIGKDYPNLNWMQKKMTEVTNLENASGTLADALRGADIFVGVSAPNIVTPEMVSSMNKDAILFAMANPVPEIMPDVAKAAGAKVVGTGRSDFPNQVNNVIAFPGIFRGALEAHATQITEEMKLAAAEALAALVSDEELNEDFIMPEAFKAKIRDGTLSYGGCAFCSAGGSGDFAADAFLPVSEQFIQARQKIAAKTHCQKFIAYFQSFTNTYAPVDVLRQLYSEAMAPEEIVALSIGTRSDCLPPETLELLSDLNQEKPIWIELGLQSIHAKTLSAMNTHTTVAQFDAAVSKLHALGISVIAHVILGFPGETKEMMKDTVRHVAALPVSGIKLQLLHVLRGTALAEQYQLHPFPMMELDEYSDFVIDCLELLPPDMVVHRLTGDGPRSLLLAPSWSTDKKRILNTIHRRLKERNTRQGEHFYG